MLAAASTAHVIDEAIERFEAGSDDRVVASYAGTSALARQIESGAPADIFVTPPTRRGWTMWRRRA